QLRPALRLGRGDVRQGAARRPAPLPGRARDLDEGRLRHVARPVRGMGLAQVPARLARPVARAHRARLRRHLLLAPIRSRDAVGELGIGCIGFSPLAQGMLTDKYLDGIPEGSRASQHTSLSPDLLTDDTLAKIRALNEVAARRGQSLAQMALAWTLRDPRMTSVLIGASSVAQLD